MPTYEYKCPAGHEFEMEQKITDRPLGQCIEFDCKERPVRLISRTSFVLKGGGWSATNYGSPK